MNNKFFITFLDSTILNCGFVRKKYIYYKSDTRIIKLIRYRKDSRFEGFYIDYGLYFIDIGISTSIPPNIWHLEGVLGNINKSFRRNFSFYSSSEEINDLQKEIQKSLIPFLDLVGDIDYLKLNFPENFNFSLLVPNNIDIFNEICSFIGKEAKLPNW